MQTEDEDWLDLLNLPSAPWNRVSDKFKIIHLKKNKKHAGLNIGMTHTY